MRYVAGELVNFLEQARSITVSPSADALFPVTRLYDGYADSVFRYGSNAADPYAIFDLALKGKDGVDNGALDTWSGGSPTGWTKTTTGTGTVVETTVGAEVRSGSAAKLNKGSGTAKLVKTYRVRSGQRFSFSLYARIAAAGSAKAQLYNPVTKKYLTSAMAWQTAQAYFATEAASTTYVEKTNSFQVESLAAHLSPITWLELTLVDDGAGGGSDFAFFDDVFLWPTWNAVVIAGHNIEPGMVATLRSSTDNFSASNDVEVTLAQRQPAMFGYDSTAITRRWAGLLFSGTQSALAGAIFAGEIAITYLETAAVGPNDGWTERFIPDNVLNSLPGGKVTATRTTEQLRRAYQFAFEHATQGTDELKEVRDEIHKRAHGSLWPVILVPIDAEDRVCHGRISDQWEGKRVFDTIHDNDLLIADNPFPRVTS